MVGGPTRHGEGHGPTESASPPTRQRPLTIRRLPTTPRAEPNPVRPFTVAHVTSSLPIQDAGRGWRVLRVEHNSVRLLTLSVFFFFSVRR